MNRRMIGRKLNRKHEEFLKSIDDESVRKLVARNSIITGGSIASMLLGEPIKDYDYYFTDQKTVIAVTNYYIKKFNDSHPDSSIKPKIEVDDERVKIMIQSSGITSETTEDSGYQYFESRPDEEGMEYVERALSEADETPVKPMDEMQESAEEKPSYRPVFLSGNAITLSDQVQLVIRFYGDVDQIHENYDFMHCTCSWTSCDKKLRLPANALEALLTKELVYQGSLYPLSSVIRSRKFVMRGWWINAGQYLKMMFQLNELDLTDINVLDEQLTGVDAAYFIQIIDYCKKRIEKDEEFKITTPYLVSIVDKIFG